MFELIPQAMADDGVAPMGGVVSQLIPMILIFVVFYIFMLRPQIKKQQEHQKMIKSVAKGDEVITAGGLVGIVKKVDEQAGRLSVQLADKVEVSVIAQTISQITKQTKKSDSNDAAEKTKKAVKKKTPAKTKSTVAKASK